MKVLHRPICSCLTILLRVLFRVQFSPFILAMSVSLSFCFIVLYVLFPQSNNDLYNMHRLSIGLLKKDDPTVRRDVHAQCALTPATYITESALWTDLLDVMSLEIIGAPSYFESLSVKNSYFLVQLLIYCHFVGHVVIIIIYLKILKYEFNFLCFINNIDCCSVYICIRYLQWNIYLLTYFLIQCIACCSVDQS